uniref:Uncharacterized protein n=1 Tax=Anguilla anguilla TaxID=7936 RepID=A0A0E9VJP3_ANGAN
MQSNSLLVRCTSLTQKEKINPTASVSIANYSIILFFHISFYSTNLHM